jgi:hypothetical protein
MNPGLLHGVVRLAQRAEHPVGHRPQVGPVGLELLCEPVVPEAPLKAPDRFVVHGHIPSWGFVIAVTNETRSV